mmetsp:Transcript_19341/g.31909  ORF Transcript_19341/g.31909 Transcript_19341/m.31909 type:complete len:212 (+) Transcript_19341:305-940(+)
MDRGVGENEKEGKGANPAPAKEDEANLSLAAAIKVQKLFRGFKDRHKWKRRVLIEAWDELEKREESELHYSSREIGRMTEMYESLAKNAVIDSDGAKKERRPSAVLKNKDEDKKDAFKPTLSWLTAFMDNCRNPSENKTIMEEKKTRVPTDSGFSGAKKTSECGRYRAERKGLPHHRWRLARSNSRFIAYTQDSRLTHEGQMVSFQRRLRR